MDDQTKLLQEIRDILRESANAAATERSDLAKFRAETASATTQALEQQRSAQRFYRRVVTVAALVVAALVIFLFSVTRH